MGFVCDGDGMKVVYNPNDETIAHDFMERFLSNVNDNTRVAIHMSECEPLFLDGDDNILNIIAEIEKIGFVEVGKAVFQGSHPYRSDCGKCPRCYRYRPEINWNNENLDKPYLCNRCSKSERTRK